MERVIEKVLLPGSEVCAVDLHENRLGQEGDEEPHVRCRVQKKFDHRDLQHFAELAKQGKNLTYACAIVGKSDVRTAQYLFLMLAQVR